VVNASDIIHQRTFLLLFHLRISRDVTFFLVGMPFPREESEAPPGLGSRLGLNDEDKVLVSRLMPRVSVPVQIPFRHAIEKVQIGIFLNANHLSAYLKVTVWVLRVHNAERDAGITLEIPKLLASFGLTKTDVGPVPVEPDWRIVWLSLRPDGGDMDQSGCVQQISVFLWNIYHQHVLPFILRAVLRSNQRRSIWSARSAALQDDFRQALLSTI
jgi:hypothetical protein